MWLISIDGGTTNTRLVLIKDGVVKCIKRLSIGARDSLVDGHNSYREVLSTGIGQLLLENELSGKDIKSIVVSGMICSEHGLYEVSHIPTPVNLNVLSKSIVVKHFEEISSIPFYLVPGVKSFSEVTCLSNMDIMRGEETELFGILSKMDVENSATIVLPGSHCKIISIDSNATIDNFSTTISGELIRAIAENTILRDGIRGAYPKDLSKNKLIEGYNYALEHGVTEALFKIRILQKFHGYTQEELFSVLCGAILSGDIKSIINRGNDTVLVGGSDPYRSAIALLLKEKTNCKVEIIPNEIADYAVAYGADLILKEISND